MRLKKKKKYKIKKSEEKKKDRRIRKFYKQNNMIENGIVPSEKSINFVPGIGARHVRQTDFFFVH